MIQPDVRYVGAGPRGAPRLEDVLGPNEPQYKSRGEAQVGRLLDRYDIPFLYEQTSEEASKPARLSGHFIIAKSLIMPKDIYNLFAELLKGLWVRFTNSVNAQTFAL